jgi:hypothetical protein
MSEEPIQYSSSGMPFREMQQLTDKEIFQAMSQGGTIHFQSSRRSTCSLQYVDGEWLFTAGDMREPQRFKNLFDWTFRMNGLGGAGYTRNGEDMDVTLEEVQS